jgi:predicted lactoylglutathione lyase
MDQRVSLITLAVDDLDRSKAFYEALGWTVTEAGDGIVAFDLLGQTISLYRRTALAADMGVDVATLGTGGATLACNVRAVEDVQAVIEQARAAGATILRDAHQVFWGGTTSYFRELDGHVWEVAYNPHVPLRADGCFAWHGYDEHDRPRSAPA